MLQLSHIQKSFGSQLVFGIEQLTLAPGIYRLQGANGAGKSTFLNMLAGLIPFNGEIVLNKNIAIRQQPNEYRMLVNHAPAEPLFPSFLTGTALVNFVNQLKKGNAQQLEQVKEWLGIDQYLHNPTGTYSSGMLKKLSLLMAFAGNPEWILLDEPLTTLDQASQKALCKMIMQQHREKNTSFIITSHHDIEITDIDFTTAFLLHENRMTEIVSIA